MRKVLVLAGLSATLAGRSVDAVITDSYDPVPATACRIAPRADPIDDLLLAHGTPPAGVVPQPPVHANQPSRDVPFVRSADLPSGPDAAPEVRDAVVATVRELTACFNANDDARIDALHSDNFFRRVAAVDWATPTGTDEAAPIGVATVSYSGVWFGTNAAASALGRAWVLPDGRIGATFLPTAAPRVFLVFVFDEASSRYLIDEEAYVVDQTTPSG